MSENSAIQWTDATWNPTTGCTKVSPACANCYIERTPPFRIAGRKFVNGHIPIQFHEDRLDAPLRWRKPRRVFVNSLSDLFHEDIPFAFVKRVWDTIAQAPQHTFQILTKRPARLLEFHRWLAGGDDLSITQWPRNAWIGVSVENQHFADERIPLLLQVPSSVLFISAEPLLGEVDLREYLVGHEEHGTPFSDPPARTVGGCIGWTPGLDWVIVGGESGPQPRQQYLHYMHSLVAQCRYAGVPVFVKQLGAKPYDAIHGLLKLKDKKGGDMSEWPDGLRVREFPT